MDGMTYKPREIALAPGDMLLLYTDGVTEAENWETDQFGMERLDPRDARRAGTLRRRGGDCPRQGVRRRRAPVR